MTTASSGGAETASSAKIEDPTTPAERRRPARRGPADLPFSFPDVGLARALAAERSEPDWLRAERIAAAEAYESLPLEKNQLYTTYVDLRGADLFAVRPYVRTAAVPAPAGAAVPSSAGAAASGRGEARDARRGIRPATSSAPSAIPSAASGADALTGIEPKTSAPDATAPALPERAGASIEPKTSAPDATAPALPEGADAFIELREDSVTALALSPAAMAAGVVLETFASALARDPEGLRATLEGGASLPAEDKLAQLARGFWSQGVRLIVPAGVHLTDPVVVRWAAGVPGRALVTRTIVQLGAGAEASLVEELVPSGPSIECAAGEPVPQSLFSGTLEVTLDAGARLAVASIQDLPAGVTVIQHRDAVIGEGADLHWALAQLGGRIVRSRVDNRLDGDRGSVEQVEIVFGSGDQVVDLTSYTRHRGRDTTGNLLSKGVLMDRARSYMKGLIMIDKPAVGTDSFLGEFGMNLSRQARAVAIPSLEIDQPDCRRAAHSSSVGPIDETQLFYLESRGIPPDEARKFIVLGFLEPVVARVPHPESQDRLRLLLEEKWAAASPGAAGSGSASAA